MKVSFILAPDLYPGFFSGPGEFDGIGDQVLKDLIDPGLITVYERKLSSDRELRPFNPSFAIRPPAGLNFRKSWQLAPFELIAQYASLLSCWQSRKSVTERRSKRQSGSELIPLFLWRNFNDSKKHERAAAKVCLKTDVKDGCQTQIGEHASWKC